MENRNLHNNYENYVESQAYNYGEFFDNLDIIKLIREEVEYSHLEKGLTEFLKSNYRMTSSRDKSNKQLEKRARKKAESLIKGDYNRHDYLSGLNSKEAFKDLVKEAVSQGYVWKFRLDEPWHPSFFFDKNRVTTFPYQHKFAVMYTGQAKFVFFSKEGKWDIRRKIFNDKTNEKMLENMVERKLHDVELEREMIDTKHGARDKLTQESIIELAKKKRAKWELREKIIDKVRKKIDEKEVPKGAIYNEICGLRTLRNSDSILEQGALLTGNQHVSEEREDYDKEATGEKAVWLGFLDKARKFPSTDVGIGMDIYNGSVVFEAEVPTKWLAIKGNKGGINQRIESLDNCLDYFKTPNEMANQLSRDDEFVIPESSGRLPLEYVKGVWDKGQFPGTPHFMSLEKFVGMMEEKFPERMPGSKTHVKSNDVNLEELKYICNQQEKIFKIREALEGDSHYDPYSVKWAKIQNNREQFEDSLKIFLNLAGHFNNDMKKTAQVLSNSEVKYDVRHIDLTKFYKFLKSGNLANLKPKELLKELTDLQRRSISEWEKGNFKKSEDLVASLGSIENVKLSKIDGSMDQIVKILKENNNYSSDLASWGREVWFNFESEDKFSL